MIRQRRTCGQHREEDLPIQTIAAAAKLLNIHLDQVVVEDESEDSATIWWRVTLMRPFNGRATPAGATWGLLGRHDLPGGPEWILGDVGIASRYDTSDEAAFDLLCRLRENLARDGA